ncbi:MAG: hypothetical protein KJ856_21305 [Gammaproteobacteria bacterium]|uniref:DUF2335 domain-containing protein n=1 Tax=viral metagenome TaxID=1070528 RepID=A0A6M3JA55_9ZZZZ|nr:hypothetical protein [Gammaproteobacteria bacterium]MBU1479266.1 hypothetical protein [Gammaproteobacteria bacterium]MBU2002267.1 hypothetical protein [Gammaproteobacteria bacterium]MBU2132140.1 hypothetical protein [Gammaproteobacteria bacterium]MBU2189521.1 hypothetical protein [Gammaproteobacteria bacterium]
MSIDNEDYDSEADVEPASAEEAPHIKSSRKAFSKLATELSDKDLSSSGVQKMLLAEITRLESAVLRAEGFAMKFHNSDKECAVLREKEKTFLFSEILYSVSLTLGAALIGIAPSISSPNYAPAAVGIIGGLLVIGAVIAKVVKK